VITLVVRMSWSVHKYTTDGLRDKDCNMRVTAEYKIYCIICW